MTTIPTLDAALALLLAYLLGSIPFGFLIARVFRGIDIRTVGSGNIGATNVGRVLGFRFFVVVFTLDFLKGYLPTRFLPGLFGPESPDLPVLVAVATILGHNFPIYLRFRGGKGVATSLGAVWALDWLASLGAALGFGLLLASFRFVSVGSIGGGLVWLLIHFTQTPHPWSRAQVALSIASIGLMILLIVRHRANLVRLARGTEPRVGFRRQRPGRVAPWLVVGLAVLGVVGGMGGAAGVRWARARRVEVVAGPYHAEEVARAATGHQRVERLLFADGGTLLAATCPRYNRVVFYRIKGGRSLDPVADFEVGGRPVALAAGADRIYVLTRPSNDVRHVQPGWWQAFDFDGRAASAQVAVGLYPDDLAVAGTTEAPRLLVLSSGRGEGDAGRPAPALTVYDLGSADAPHERARVDFDGLGDDPGRLALAKDGRLGAVSLVGPKPAVAWLDLADLDHPRLLRRVAWPASSPPESLRFDANGALLAVDDGESEGQGTLWCQADPNAEPTQRPIDGGAGDVVAFDLPGLPPCWALSLPFDSGVAFLSADSAPDRSPDRLPLLGGWARLSGTRPVGLAVDPARGLLGVANRSGGSVHLITLRPVSVSTSTSGPVAHQPDSTPTIASR